MAQPSDRSLLDRLNALKPTSVNLDRSTNALSIPAAGIEPAAPLSREDALTERLRSLRNRRDHHLGSSEDSGDPPPPYTASSPATGAQPRPSTSAREVTGSASHGDETGRRRAGSDDEDAGGGSQSSGEYDDYFDDVLQPLDLEDDEDGDSGSEGEGGSSKRVEDLLAKLRADPGAQPPLPADSKPGASRAKDAGSGSDDDDDSEGEVMSREVENVISRAMDELKLDGSASQPAGPDEAAIPGGTPKADDGAGGRAAESRGDELALPTVPQDAAGDKKHDTSSKPPQPGGNNGDNDGDAGLSLPAVPTALVDPAPTSGPAPRDGDDPFESSIAARLAALKGAQAPIIHTDALGLPSAPTFRPEDNTPAPKRLVARAGGYTDADQKTWCIVCLEDGTIRCLGCDDDGGGGDVYCARCWKEMHVGPSAGYDERGHAWEKFDPRRL